MFHRLAVCMTAYGRLAIRLIHHHHDLPTCSMTYCKRMSVPLGGNDVEIHVSYPFAILDLIWFRFKSHPRIY